MTPMKYYVEWRRKSGSTHTWVTDSGRHATALLCALVARDMNALVEERWEKYDHHHGARPFETLRYIVTQSHRGHVAATRVSR